LNSGLNRTFFELIAPFSFHEGFYWTSHPEGIGHLKHCSWPLWW